MTYLSAAATSVDDVAAFAEAGKSWASARLAEMGALSTTANQVIMGGEAAGTVIVAFEWESIDAAMAGLPVPLHPGALKYYKEVGLDVPAHLMAK